MKILSLDVSASSTGYAFTANGKDFIVGTIKTTSKFTRSERLNKFAGELSLILNKLKPTYIVIEDTFAGKNIKTLKILNEFAGVAKYICYKITGIEPYIISNHTVKAFYKSKTKNILFDFVVEQLLYSKKSLTFSKDNDIIDALAQLCCYTQNILEVYTFREDKEYGFLYFSLDI